MKKNINILGTDYTVNLNATDKDFDADNMAGEANSFLKTISINEDLLPGRRVDVGKQREVFKVEVLRHEIIHAFFDESGLDCYSTDERLVDWIAVQIPKILTACKEVDAI